MINLYKNPCGHVTILTMYTILDNWADRPAAKKILTSKLQGKSSLEISSCEYSMLILSFHFSFLLVKSPQDRYDNKAKQNMGE